MARRKRRDATDRLHDLVLWVVLPLAALVMLVVAIDDIGPAYAARARRGTYGEFRGTERRCHEAGRTRGATCELWGEFTPEDGGPVVVVRHAEPPGVLGVNGKARALLPEGEDDTVFRVRDSMEWLKVTAVAIVASGGLVLWAVLLLRRQQRT